MKSLKARSLVRLVLITVKKVAALQHRDFLNSCDALIPVVYTRMLLRAV
jgi:hypothetical protein